jgi:cell division protease FtsH
MGKKTQLNIWYAILAILAVLLFQQWWAESQAVETIAYSDFENLLKTHQVESVAIGPDYIQGTLKSEAAKKQKRFVTARVDPRLVGELDRYGVKYSGVATHNFLRGLLSWILPIAIFFFFWMFVVRRYAEKQGYGGIMSIGRSKAKIYVEKNTKTHFDDVAGLEEAKEELREIVEFLKQPKTYGRLGARVPKGVLLLGPPGTGKTLLARAVAGEAGVMFLSINGSEFVEMFVGVGAARVRDLFEQARKSAPCIIFVDELDALGRARGVSPSMGGHDEKEQTLNQLLVELDGFDPREGVVLIAATNRPEILDPALLRAGRFDRQILVDRPDKLGRIAILKVHMRKVRIAPDVDSEQIAAITPGFSGADLANLVNEAALLATRRKASAVAMSDFTAAIERIVAGLEKRNRVLTPHEREVVATHEMGHALVAKALPTVDPVHKISIIPRGISALGYTMQRPTDDRHLMSRQELEDKLTVLLGGRAAEQLVFGEISTGAADDLDKATNIARNMATRYGMDERLGLATYDPPPNPFLPHQPGPQQHAYSDETADEIDRTVREMLARLFEKATSILGTYRAQLDEGVARLLEKETLLAEELPALEPAPQERRRSA